MNSVPGTEWVGRSYKPFKTLLELKAEKEFAFDARVSTLLEGEVRPKMAKEKLVVKKCGFMGIEYDGNMENGMRAIAKKMAVDGITELK